MNKEEKNKDSIHIVQASFMTKNELIMLIYGYNDSKYINPEIPLKFWIENDGNYHPTAYVWDSRLKKPVHLMDKGISKGLIHKTDSNNENVNYERIEAKVS